MNFAAFFILFVFVIWTNPGDSTLQSSNYTATHHPSQKLLKLDEPDMRDTAGEVGTSS